jgi:hypothetical protein
VLEDVTGRFVTYFGRNGLVAAVRPDRTVLGVCDAEQADALVTRVFELLSSRATEEAP